ncbi:MAG TPA: phospholipase D-like domain-containing protein, partial [Phycisphaerae bacterium]|nr:phospholipase D-like domain-containing protein [Phycisphaerae bacterium]
MLEHLSYWVWVYTAVTEAAALLVIVVLLRRPRDPRAMLVWILTLILLPGLGLVLFATMSEPRRKWHRVRRHRSRKQLKAYMQDHSERLAEEHICEPEDAKPELRPLVRLTERLGAYLPTHGNEITIYQDAEKTFEAIEEALQSARSHIHLEYYIFQPDETGAAIRDLLIEKTHEGVEVRLLLDFLGCWRLSRRFLRPLRAAGAQIAWSLPMVPLRGRWRVNFRNHRKIAIVDGRIGFTGSQNIGDEYRGRLRKLGPWRDTHLKIEGPAVLHLQEVFAHDWHYTTKQELTRACYFPRPRSAGQHVVQIAPSGPDQCEHVMHQLLSSAVHS